MDLGKVPPQDIEAEQAVIGSMLTDQDAVVAAINLGEDTDTIGAITGSLNGIIYGKNNIPERWLNKLKKKDYLEELSNQFISTINYEERSKSL